MNRSSKSNFRSRLLVGLGFTFIVAQVACAPSSSSSGAGSPPKDDGPISTSSACETDGPLQLNPNANGRYTLLNLAPRSDRLCVLILPIDSQALNAVLRGAKTVDYRRSHPLDRVSHILYYNNKTLELYATAEVDHSLAGAPREIAELTSTNAGTNLNGALNYFGGRNYGFAIAIKNAQILANPIGMDEARALDARFQRPYGYLFLERHPKLNQVVAKRLGLSSAL